MLSAGKNHSTITWNKRNTRGRFIIEFRAAPNPNLEVFLLFYHTITATNGFLFAAMAENLVQAMEDLYKTMLHMCGDQTLDVKFAPEGGHILPPGLIAVLEVRKTPAAIDLIRRIPYFGWSQHVLPNSEAINYLRLRLGEFPCAWRPVKYGNMNNEAHLSSDSLGDSIVKPCEVPVITVSVCSRDETALPGTNGYGLHSTMTRSVRFLS